MPRRDVDQEVLDLAGAHCLEELADRADVPVVHERMRRLQDVPGRPDELPERRLQDLAGGDVSGPCRARCPKALRNSRDG